MRRLLVCGLILFGGICTGSATTVYLDRNGNDANPGTPERPLRSLQALSKRSWNPGDAIYFHGGQTFSGTILLPGGGSDSAPVIVGSYDKGKATIQASGEFLVAGYNQGGFQFQDLNLTCVSSKKPTTGILFYSDSRAGTRYPGVIIKNCDLHGFGGVAIKIGSWHPSNPGWTKIRVENCRVNGNGEGMAVFGYDASARSSYANGYVRVTHSEFANNLGPGLSLCGVNGGTVDYCSFHDNQSLGGCWTWAARNVLIQHSISYRNHRGTGNDGFGFDLDGGSVGCTIEYCLSFENETAGFAIFDYPNSGDTLNNTIRYCISENDVRADKEGGSFAINSWANTPIRTSNITNCVAYLSSRGGKSICAGFLGIGRQAADGFQSGEIAGCSFANNLIYLNGAGSDLKHVFCQKGANAPAEILFRGNAYGSTSPGGVSFISGQALYTTLEEWQSKTGQESGGSSANIGCELSINQHPVSLGQLHTLTDPAVTAMIKAGQNSPPASCLQAGSDGKSALRLTQERIPPIFKSGTLEAPSSR